MKELLFVNACVRGEQSRTLKLARHFLAEYAAQNPGDGITERNLCQDRLQPQYPEILEQQEVLKAAGRTDQPLFEAARQFAGADKIVIAAPFWELAYPAILAIYLERISAVGIAFRYGEGGAVEGLCKAERLLLVTIRGGVFSTPETAHMEMGARHLEALCGMYGIEQFQCLCAEGLDDVRNDPQAILRAAMEQGTELAGRF